MMRQQSECKVYCGATKLARRRSEVSSVPRTSIRKYLLRSNRDARISATRTIVFVDQNGIVKSVWIGAQTEREKEMRDTLVSYSIRSRFGFVKPIP